MILPELSSLPLKRIVAISIVLSLATAAATMLLKTLTFDRETTMVEATKYPLKLTMILNKTTFKVGKEGETYIDPRKYWK